MFRTYALPTRTLILPKKFYILKENFFLHLGGMSQYDFVLLSLALFLIQVQPFFTFYAQSLYSYQLTAIANVQLQILLKSTFEVVSLLKTPNHFRLRNCLFKEYQHPHHSIDQNYEGNLRIHGTIP